MLGVIVSGRLAQTDFMQVGECQFCVNITDADNINHIVVFLTGTVRLPEGNSAAVYFSWPDTNAPPSWQYLGYISNNKPSAIFKISQLKKLHEMETNELVDVFGSQISHIAQIGVSIEADNVIAQLVPATTNGQTYYNFGQKMLENFFNFSSSFALTQQQMVPNPAETYVPLSTLQTWFNNFQRRLQQNPNFWKL